MRRLPITIVRNLRDAAIHQGSGLCLDASGAATGNGTVLILFTCQGSTNQQWRR